MRNSFASESAKKIIKHVVILRISCWSVDIGHCMCPWVLKRHLSVVGQDVPGGSIIDWYRDQALSIETASSITDAYQEDGQVVRFPIEFLFVGRDCLVVQFGCHRSGIGVVVMQDGM